MEGGRERERRSTIYNSLWVVELTYLPGMSTDQSSIQFPLGRHSCSHDDPTD